MSQTGQTGAEGGSAGEMLDAEEFGAAVDGLSAADKFKLREIEKVYRRGTDLNEGDLLHEALCAAILGDRKCPRAVPVMAFVVQTMRSLASHRREKHARERADGGTAQEKAGVGAAIAFASAALDPEEMLIEQQEVGDTVGEILACFEGDEEAQMVVLGWSAGRRGKELREYVGVEQAALDYAIKRIRRAMTKRYPHGWKKP
ncbi:MAG TPA: sigma-70 family RNA polymerase sigma factor [Xanthobacteraceae bacterium]|nr:sigma-70 family RNA polymerase sigma factor [Xanthobacteraceae bacterium]